MKIDGGNNMMGPRMSTNLTVNRQTPDTGFGARVQAGLNTAAGAVAGGLGTVAGMVPGGGIVSAAVSTMSTFGQGATPGSMSQYGGAMGAMSSGATGVPSVNTTVVGGGGVPGAPGFVGGSEAGGAPGSPLGATGGSATDAVQNSGLVQNMFSEQKKLLQLQATMQHSSSVFQAMSNVMKTKDQSAKNAIGNIR